MDTSSDNSEILRETLLDLARSREDEERQRRTSEALLAGLRVLIKPAESSRMFLELLEVMREVLDFEDAFVLLRRPDGSLLAAASTSEDLRKYRWWPKTLLNRVLSGQAAAVFDVRMIDEWRQQPRELLDRVRSALHIPLRGGEQAAILVCIHSRRSFFSRSHQRLAEQFSTLASQALLNVERQQMETQLFQARKMEALGILAGGIAHDFNNILTPIVIHSQMAQLEAEANPLLRQSLQQIEQAAERATALISQILDFNRQGRHEPRPIRLGQVIKEATKFLRSTIAPNIEMEYKELCENQTVAADPTQMLQVVMNLSLNAAHAMRERGGKLEITLDQTEAPASIPREKKAQQWLKLVVSDSGPGIAPEHIDRIFDPFFTTKARGEGSGMGLAVVHGIIHKHGGIITAYSEPGRGACFEILLPQLAEVDDKTPSNEEKREAPVGNWERVLFVDDELPVVEAFAPMLEKFGYRVDTTTSGEAALESIRNNPKGYDLLITDFNMPGVNGSELARMVKEINPELPIILCTGFSGSVNEESCREIGISAYVTKPFNFNEFARIIRSTLNAAQ